MSEMTATKKRHPVLWGMDKYILGYATTAAGAMRHLRKIAPGASKAKLSRGKRPYWYAIYD